MKEFNSKAEELAWFVGLVEGEGSFHVATDDGRQFGRFSLKMSDLDVIKGARDILRRWGIFLNITLPGRDERWKDPKQMYKIETRRAFYLKIIIDKTYSYYSEKKQGDCDRVLKNLADRGFFEFI